MTPEGKALKEYPEVKYLKWYGTMEDLNKPQRRTYIKGYKQCQKDIIDKACEWLHQNLGKYLNSEWFALSDSLDDFRKAMEDDK